jgi:enamine deaminase RidA (YjgF/YER057c/UK114 family)
MSPPVPWGFISAGLPIHRRPFTQTTLLRSAAPANWRSTGRSWLRRKQKGNTDYEFPEPIDTGVSHQIGHYADAIRVPAGYEQVITSGTPGLTADGELPDNIAGQARQAWQNVEAARQRPGQASPTWSASGSG